MVSTYPQKQSQINAPDYWTQQNTAQNTDQTAKNPLLMHEPPPEDPKRTLRRKYPIQVITSVVILALTTLSIPLGVYLIQRPTKVFIEATSTPSPTPTPTESARPSFISE
jgi:type VI protein secretion system component VasF